MSSGSPQKITKKVVNRCAECNKKLGLFPFRCSCDGLFCATHRYSESHSCPFDYKGLAKDQLTKSNPVITPKKVDSF
jgi:AN1-type zinc finger protein 5/6